MSTPLLEDGVGLMVMGESAAIIYFPGPPIARRTSHCELAPGQLSPAKIKALNHRTVSG